MSQDNNETVTAEAPKRNMVSTNGKALNTERKEGNLDFIKLSKLSDNDVNTIIAAGIYEGTQTYAFEDGYSRTDFIVRGEDGNAKSISPCATLVKQLGKVKPGSYVELTYTGKKAIKGGKMAHGFVVGVSADDFEQA